MKRTLVVAPLILTLLLAQAGCDKSLLAQSAEVVATAQDVVESLKTVYGPDDPRLARAALWLERAERVRRSIEQAADETATLAQVAELVRAFQTDILPHLDASPDVRLAIAAVDVALRVLARRLEREANRAARNRPDVARSPQTGYAVRVLSEYLATPPVQKTRK